MKKKIARMFSFFQYPTNFNPLFSRQKEQPLNITELNYSNSKLLNFTFLLQTYGDAMTTMKIGKTTLSSK